MPAQCHLMGSQNSLLNYIADIEHYPTLQIALELDVSFC